jgi:hypothetical protein
MSNPLGGLPPMRPDQLIPSTAAGVAPGAAAAVLRVTEIIITPGSALEGIFTYSSNPGALGTLIESASVAAPDIDQYGNAYLQGNTVYEAGSTYIAQNTQAGTAGWYTAPGPGGPWTFVGSLTLSTPGTLVISGFTDVAISGDVSLLNNAQVTGTLSAAGAAFAVDASGNLTTGPDLNLTPPMGAISGYPFSGVTQPTPTNFSSGWFANVDGVLNALVAGYNQDLGERIGRGMNA